MYLGDGKMVNAPTFGKPVQTAFYRYSGDDYLGATRPAAIGEPGSLPLPQAPAPTPRPVEPDEFEAPPAPLPAEPLPAPTDPQPPESESAAAALDGASTEPVPPTTIAPPAPAPVVPLEPTASLAPTSPSSVTPASSAAAVPSAAPVPAVTTPIPTPTPTPTPSTTTPPVPPSATTSTTTALPATTPSATVPPVSAPPTSATSTPATASSANRPADRRITSLTVGGTTIPLRTVGAGPDAVPAAAGVWTSRDRTVVRLASAALDGATPETPLTLTRADGTTSRHTVLERGLGDPADLARLIAAQPAGTVVLIAPAADGSWTIVRA